MDILIKRMEMPSCCGLCPCFHAEHPMYCQADKTIRMTAPYGKRMEGCPLVALPEHGDLIDRKALSDAIGKVITDRDRMIGTYDTIEQIIEDAPTIVEATE